MQTEIFKTPDGKPLKSTKEELAKTAKKAIKLWESIENERGWKTHAKRELAFWRFMLKQANETTKKNTRLKAPAKGLVTLCSKTVGVTGRRKKDGTQKKGYIATKGGKLVKKPTAKKVKM